MIDKLSGIRKLLVMLLILIVGVSFRLTEYLNGTELVELIKTCAVGFFGANLTEHIVSGVKSVIKSKIGKE